MPYSTGTPPCTTTKLNHYPQHNLRQSSCCELVHLSTPCALAHRDSLLEFFLGLLSTQGFYGSRWLNDLQVGLCPVVGRIHLALPCGPSLSHVGRVVMTRYPTSTYGPPAHSTMMSDYLHHIEFLLNEKMQSYADLPTQADMISYHPTV